MEMTILPSAPDHIAPDGAEVRVLLESRGGGLAHFRLGPGRVSIAHEHRSIEELWYFVAGTGRMIVGDDVTDVAPGVAIRIPPGTRFQFRCDGPVPLEAVAATMPPWPGAHEALPAENHWPPTEG